MRHLLTILLASTGLWGTTAVLAADRGLTRGSAASGALGAAETAAAEPKRLIVAFRPGVGEAARESALDGLGLKEVSELGAFNAVIAEAPEGKFRLSAMRIMSDPSVLYAEEDVRVNWLQNAAVGFHQVPLPEFSQVMSALPKFEVKGKTEGEIPWGIARVNAEKAWPRTQGERAKVAVVDTGIDFTHPDLAANYAGGVNFVDSKKPPMDDNSHGSHVAGTIAGVKDGKGVVGVAPKARLYAVKVLDAEGGGNLTDIIKGLIWCGRNGMHVANFSLGAPVNSVFMRLAVSYAKMKGVAVIAAAGNSGGSVSYPAAFEDAIAVAASDSKDRIAEFSSRGPQVDFIAPGVDVLSSVPGGKYESYSGTSMAAPHVAGLAALAVSLGASGPEGVRAALKKAAAPVGLAKEEEGNGLIDAAKLAAR